LLAILDKNAIIRLGLWDGHEVYVVPLNFVRKDGTLYFHSAGTGRKLEILKSYPRVCFETEGPFSIDLNRKHGAGEGPFPADLVRRTAVLRIDIERMTGKSNKGRM
jgi:nitroimidazol reductase NimA-like FMN-containing flavoprotein (pyridoxamine 5'-phosphate oxidase superfamily)